MKYIHISNGDDPFAPNNKSRITKISTKKYFTTVEVASCESLNNKVASVMAPNKNQ